MDSAAELFFPHHHKLGFFRSPAWQQAWRQQWGQHPALVPLMTATEEVPEFYRFRESKRGIPVRTAIPAGVSSSVAASIRSEYFCFPRSTENPETDIKTYLELALEHPWDQLYVPDILTDTDEFRALLAVAEGMGLYATEQERETAYAVDLRAGTFADYTAALGKNTRLKLFNRRKRVEQEGEVKVDNIWPDRKGFYELLNEFHRVRWGKPCYQGRNLEFIDTLLAGLAKTGRKVDLSVMTLNGKPISAALDITAHGRCYNLQAGYIEDLIKGVSLGTLHFGYQIEAAFSNGAEFYDFMAGTGKNAQYKTSLANSHKDFVSLMLVRNPLLKLAYKIRDSRR